MINYKNAFVSIVKVYLKQLTKQSAWIIKFNFGNRNGHLKCNEKLFVHWNEKLVKLKNIEERKKKNPVNKSSN